MKEWSRAPKRKRSGPFGLTRYRGLAVPPKAFTSLIVTRSLNRTTFGEKKRVGPRARVETFAVGMDGYYLFTLSV